MMTRGYRRNWATARAWAYDKPQWLPLLDSGTRSPIENGCQRGLVSAVLGWIGCIGLELAEAPTLLGIGRWTRWYSLQQTRPKTDMAT